jgi:hypothetical protein
MLEFAGEVVMSMDAATLMAQAADLTHRAADLLAVGRVEEAEEAARQAQRLRHRALRQARKGPSTDPSALYTPAQSERDTIVEGLTELDAIASPRLLSDYVAARFSRSFSPRQFSSMRRDEREAWKRPASSRRAFVVPALEGSFLTPARGLIAVSTWPTWRRIVGPRTGRVELLRAGRNVIEQLEWLAGTDSNAAQRMERLLVTLARTVPGALDGWTIADRQRARAAIERELAVLQEPDEQWRKRAAERAEAHLDEAGLLWGVRAPHIVRTGGSGR